MGQTTADVSTAVAAVDHTQAMVWKTSASMVLGLAGLYYLMTGRKNQEFKPMLVGCVLILLAALVF
jgi:cytochrome bd-type quinol oxidase subunit 1